ncbi:hypothetical protein JW948_11665 [bacterium]|nr:hypothetical protein [bacterium]
MHSQYRRIHRARLVLKGRTLVFRATAVLSIMNILFLCILLLETLLYFSPAVRTGLVIVFTALGLPLCFWGVLNPVFSFFRKTDPEDDVMALKIGRHFPHIRDRLLNALQIMGHAENTADGTSARLAESAFALVDHETQNLDYTAAVRSFSLVPSVRLFLFLLVTAMTLILTGHPVQSALIRLSHPSVAFERPRPFQWIIEPGSIQLTQGDSLTISVRFFGDTPESVQLIIGKPDNGSRRIQLDPPYTAEIAPVKSSFRYRIRADQYDSDWFQVDIQRYPTVRSLQVKLNPPAYTGLPDQVLEPNTGHIESVRGTLAHISIKADQELRRAVLQFESGNRKPFTVQNNHGRLVFTVHRTDQYRIAIEDTQGLKNSNPIQYAIRIRPDLSPVARITVPGKNVDLDDQMLLNLVLEAEDDFGFSDTRLAYWIEHGGREAEGPADTVFVPLADRPEHERFFTLAHAWNLDGIGLMPKDVIGYFFEVWDNDMISGPKRGRSDSYTARFPSLLEIFEDVNQMQNDQAQSLESMARQGSDLEQKLNELSEDLKAEREIHWEEKRQVRELLENQMQLEKQMDSLIDQIDDMTERLKNHDMISGDVLEKYEELQNIFQEMATPELQEAMKKLQASMENMDDEAMRRAVEDMEINQDMLMKSLERTIALLKKIQMEQKIDEMIHRVENLAREQRSVNDSLLKQGASDPLAEKERELSQEAGGYEQSMESLAESMQQETDMPVQEMQALMDSLNQSPVSGQMSQMSDSLSADRTQSSAMMGMQISQNLSGMSEGLQRMKESMQSRQDQKARQALERAAFQTLQLSQSQESLMQQMQRGTMGSSESAQRQAAMMQGVRQISDSLYKASMQMMQMSPQIGQALGSARSGMEQAAQMIQQGESPFRKQASAMGALNETSALLQDMLGNMQGGMGGSGLEQLMSQLGDMSEQQMALNRKLADMLGQGQLSLQQQAALSRLASEQRAIQKHIEKLLNEYGERAEVAGRLGELIREMEKAVQELNENPSSKTLERQEQILSRLLDAQRSVHERDFSRMREAISGRDIVRRGPAGISPSGNPDMKEQLLRELLRLNEAGYSRDYQALIRQYFQSLIQQMEEDGAASPETE